MRYCAVIFSMLILFLTGCSKDYETQASESVRQNHGDHGSISPFRSIPPAQALKLIQEREDLLLVDVRSPQELREGAIEGSQLIPFWEILRGKRILPKDRPILLICAVGGRSYSIGRILANNGWPEIYNLSGGIAAWKRSGYSLKY